MTTCVDTLGRPAPCQAPLSYADRLSLAYNAGFRGDNLITIVAISQAESQGIPNNKNPGSPAYGVVQINRSQNPNVSIMQALSPQFAFTFAKHLVDSVGFSRAFETYSTTNPKISYQQYMQPVAEATQNWSPSSSSSLPGIGSLGSLPGDMGATLQGAPGAIGAGLDVVPNLITGAVTGVASKVLPDLLPNVLAGVPSQLQTVGSNLGKSALPYLVIIAALVITAIFLLRSFIK